MAVYEEDALWQPVPLLHDILQGVHRALLVRILTSISGTQPDVAAHKPCSYHMSARTRLLTPRYTCRYTLASRPLPVARCGQQPAAAAAVALRAVSSAAAGPGSGVKFTCHHITTGRMLSQG
jgi:hypothetical protein